MRIIQRPNRDRSQDTSMFDMTGRTGLSLLNNVGMKCGHIGFGSRSKLLAGMTR
jgi:hypothetical protein